MAIEGELKARIGRQIRRVREQALQGRGSRRKGMTIEAVAEASRISANYLTKLELGHHMPSAEKLLMIAKALRVDVRELFPDEIEGSADRRDALESLRAFASQFTAPEIRWMTDVLSVAAQRPTVPTSTKRARNRTS